MAYDLKDAGTGAPPGGVNANDFALVLRDGAQAPYKTPWPTAHVTRSQSGYSQTLAFPPSGNVAFDITLTANCAFLISGGSSAEMQTLTLVIRGGNGGFSATLPNNVKWPGGVAPTVDGSAGSYNEFYIRTLDGGATYSGNY